MSTTRKPILIAGAGPSSLLLAQALNRASIPFRIFERDASVAFRAQGYRLRLSSEGLSAIESVLGPEKWQEFWDTCGRTGGGGFAHIDSHTGEIITPDPPKKDEKDDNGAGNLNNLGEILTSRDGRIVGISRGDMRRLFMAGCEDSIFWSHHVTGYELTVSGVRAVFADGSRSEEGDMLVGGEGIYSKVAKQVSKGALKVYDTGARAIHGQAPTAAFKGLGEGVFRITDESNPKGKIFIMTNVRSGDMDNPDLEFGWTLGGEPGVITAPNDNYSIIGETAANIAKDLTSNWHPRFKPLFDQMNTSEAAFWKITCSTPTGVPEWDNEPRVTVIGDAAHSMTPAGGLGANTAVQDSVLLGRLLVEAGGWKEGVTEMYEREMRIYGSRAVDTSYNLAKAGFGIYIDENSETV
ncbi:hypothetical protein ONS95_002732 [Cadophora gregata]|uniref:uncharacterized protein n=1 Tax=Cadophora gregata TaxID=51156 RepID=UPI0026DCF3AF|nr:uncharacterized protein ONS95_002732 [Cadophora gregata]KAK0110075.1 hypothetical protein ONS95_002732 [Cadophora gregata]KAK0110305.1 hypothetical protein ONS96_001923 [Cadophora gregata f. sp. sojae]